VDTSNQIENNNRTPKIQLARKETTFDEMQSQSQPQPQPHTVHSTQQLISWRKQENNRLIIKEHSFQQHNIQT
jgi:hypothetical protein